METNFKFAKDMANEVLKNSLRSLWILIVGLLMIWARLIRVK